MSATREQRQSRYEKRAARLTREASDAPRKVPDERQQAVRAARAELSKKVAELDLAYQPKIAELLQEYGEKKRAARADYEERVRLIKQAHLLGS